MKRISIIGHFGFGLNCSDGQTVKTRIFSDELITRFGEKEVLRIDTHGNIISFLLQPFKIFKALRDSRNVIILPAHNGLRFIAPLLAYTRSFFKNRFIHYVVIGGWLPVFLDTRKSLENCLKSFDGVYVETSTMRNALEQRGFTNVSIVRNCKKLNTLVKNDLHFQVTEPYKLCTFSRVNQEKGIEDAVSAVVATNESLNRIVYTLDIYGPIESAQSDWFYKLKNRFPDYIKYCGIIPFDQSVNILKDYFALLFPTRYFTEGIPGTIIDAYAAGIPVISTKWESFADVIDDKITGIGYTFGNNDELYILLESIADNPDLVLRMKKNCISKAEEFSPESALKTFCEMLYAEI